LSRLIEKARPLHSRAKKNTVYKSWRKFCPRETRENSPEFKLWERNNQIILPSPKGTNENGALATSQSLFFCAEIVNLTFKSSYEIEAQ
jgi:hypothetical protein